MENQFNLLKGYINSNETIHRRDILKFNNTKGSSTIDTYRVKLSKLGYLSTVRSGEYKRIKKIPQLFNTVNLTNSIFQRKFKDIDDE